MTKNQQDDKFIVKEKLQFRAETSFCEEFNFDKVDMTDSIASSRMTNLSSNETLSWHVESLPREIINSQYIIQYQMSIDEYENGKKSQIEPIIHSGFIRDLNLQLFSLYIKSLPINTVMIAETIQFSTDV